MPDPPSTIVLGSSYPLTIAVIAGLLVSTTVNPSSGFEKIAGAGGVSTAVIPDFSPSVNQGTNCNSRPNGSVIWHSCNAFHVGFSGWLLSVSFSLFPRFDLPDRWRLPIQQVIFTPIHCVVSRMTKQTLRTHCALQRRVSDVQASLALYCLPKA